MNMNVDKAAKYSLERATEYLHCGNYGRAFAHFILYFELDLENRLQFEDNFINVTALWCNDLEKRKQTQNVRYCYTQALRYFPDNPVLLNHYAAHYARCNETRMAIKYFEIAHAVHPDYLPAEKNLQSMYASKVPQWHFRMLNDKRRNELYKLAIESTLKRIDNCSSNDGQFQLIDIGTGSGLLSLFAAAYKQQVRNEMNIIAVEGCDIMAQIANRIFSCNNATVELIERLSTEITKQNIYNLLITEIFDCCLFGEGVMSTLIHAHKELLAENAVVLPYAAKLLIFGIESAELDSKYRFRPTTVMEANLKVPKCIRKIHEEPYDAFSINSYDYKQITNVQEVVTVNFNDAQQLEKMYNDEGAMPAVTLQVLADGTCHAFVICFELWLDKQGEYKITTNPLERHSGNFCYCWEQGIVFLKHPEELIQTQDALELNVSATSDKLKIKYHVEKNKNAHAENYFEISTEAIAQLNFEALTTQYVKVVANFNEEQWPKTVLELSPLPLFSILLLKRGKVLGKETKITFSCRKDHLKLVQQLLELNEVDEGLVTILDSDSDLLQVVQMGIKFDCIVYEPMVENGLINEVFYNNASDFKHALNENGLFLPNEAHLCFEIVESRYMDECTKAMEENLFGFSIAKKINEFSVNEMRTLSGRFTHKKLSHIVRTPMHMEEDSRETTINVRFTDTGRANGFLYWFECNYFGDIVSTLSTTYNQGAFVLIDKDKVDATCDGSMQVKVKQDHGLLKIFT